MTTIDAVTPSKPVTPKLYVATPLSHGNIHMATAVSMWRFFKDPNFIIAPQPGGAFNEDVYRVRSRIARHFLKTDCTHLFFLDADVSCGPEVLKALLAAERPVVAAPYPKKHMRNFPNYEPTWYPLGLQEGDFMPALVPMGCTLISREAVERVSRECSAEYERRLPTLLTLNTLRKDYPDAMDVAMQAVLDGATVFGDVVDNELTPHVFGPITGDNPIHPEHPPNAWPEDMSFCLRCNRIGIPTVMHMGVTAYHHEGSVMFPVKEGR